jgi:hypothetical protein
MPNAIKYKAGNLTGSLQKGNVALAVNDIAGPTSTTGWYNGPNFTQGTYQIIETAATGDPDVFCPQNDAELIKFVKWKGATGGNTGSVGAALAWIATQNNLLATNEVYPNIVTSGLAMILDAGFVGSYPTTASTWYDISGNNISGSLINGPTFNINGAIVFDGVDDNVNCGNNTNPLLNPGPSEAWSLSATFKNSQSIPNDNTIYGIAGKRVINETNGYTLMLRGGSYNGVLARLSNSGKSLVDILPTTNYSTILANGQYHQMVMTYGTNDTGSLYIDGVLVGQAVAPNFDFNNSNSAFKIGVGDTNNAHPFNGSINSVSFYNRSLSQAEILQNYYQAPIVTNGLVLALDAGNLVSYESGSTTTYSLTGSISGSLTNGTSYNSENGGAWSFDGTDDSISVLDNAVLDFTGSVNLTSEVWINLNLYKDISIVNAKGNGGGQIKAYNYLFVGSNTAIAFRFSDGINDQSSPTISKFILPEGTWGHVVGVLDTTAIRIYLNGVEIGTATTRTINPKANNDPFYISTSTYSLNGKIGISRIYNRALTAAEVTQNFNAQKARFGF